MPRIELERIEEVDETSQSSTESFDRIAFAERALALVRPPGTTVAICPGTRRVRVQAGRQWGAAMGQRWAVLSVPMNASRRAIANAVLELGDGTPPRAWALDVLLAGANGPGTPYRGHEP
ncbi:MAG: hypothetical protein JWO86_6975 [Myxococcaceae bacterium]|jgi:hypothetical protein|nr:hypothetical protein [Myxococcaceae bacterium]MEA2752605.1 hypothetical protein [Myxococcales bacterium]